ncbi:hypothetical protein GQ457_09G022430 [Hibiscus cannabinus]
MDDVNHSDNKHSIFCVPHLRNISRPPLIVLKKKFNQDGSSSYLVINLLTGIKNYNKFCKNLKLVIHDNSTNKTKLIELLLYHSTKSGDEMTSLKDYVTGMKESRSDIYYITVEKTGYEVLYTIDAIEEYVARQVKGFEGKKLGSVTKEGLKLDKSEEEKQLAAEEISSMVSVKMHEIDEVYNDSIVKNDMVIVSTHLKNYQRQTTKIASVIVGLNVMRITNEPEIVAINGGTFIVSLFNIEEWMFEVKVIFGDIHIGNEGFNNRTFNHFTHVLKRKNKIFRQYLLKSMSLLRVMNHTC